MNVPARIRDPQRTAADPATNAWVKANAGSGKTHVLTERVLRLLLAGVAPEAVLCLTYTKAAAANMRERVAGRLGKWALASDAELDEMLVELQSATPDAETRARARRLFARALDTPGGLKINTIHAFCESVLHRFPLEAGVPFDFAVIEDDQRNAMIAAARERVLAEGLRGDSDIAAQVERLHEAASDFSIAQALDAALAFGSRLRTVLDNPRAEDNLRAALSVDKGTTVETVDVEILAGAKVDPAGYEELAAHLGMLGGAKTLADSLTKAAAVQPVTPRAMLSAFLNADLSCPKNLNLTKSVEADAGLAGRIEAETLRLAALAEKRAAAVALANSTALAAVLRAILKRYDRAKRARALVDFDDLVSRIEHLLRNHGHQWVAYRLDAGIDHILVDESQDTNPEQWAVVTALADEFFAGEGVERPGRTIFAVGDEKQSIFSFQGAEPALFATTGDTLEARAADAARPWRAIELKASFRSLPPILDAVDAVFENPAAHRGLDSSGLGTAHEAHRRGEGGFVELWPLVEPDPGPEPDDDAPYRTDPVPERPPQRVLAERIAGEVADWIASGRRLSGENRVVAPGDVLILVQRRDRLFHEIIRALKAGDIPNAGADKLSIVDHIAVKDLMVLGDVMLNAADDLGLATVLRSPLIGFGEAELETVCTGRGDMRLWPALERLAERQKWAAAAFGKLAAWRARLDLDRPYDFFARILYAEGGLKALHARLGPEVDDVIAEFLDLALAHEHDGQPSLQGFIAGLRAAGREIKRELSAPAGVVRVMTVHGAKGLESPIVILADAALSPAGMQTRLPVVLNADRADPGADLLLWNLGTGQSPCPPIDGLKADKRDAEIAEYHRKLYVAMTRAGAELFVTGIAPSRAGSEPSWFDLIATGLGDRLTPATDRRAIDGTIRRYPAGTPWPGRAEKTRPTPVPGPPGWLFEPAPFAVQRRIVEPSRAAEKAAGAGTGSDAVLARQRGIAIHSLLQLLPGLPPAERRERGSKALESLLPGEEDTRRMVLDRALAILADPELDWLFSEQSRGEVAVAAEFDADGTVNRLTGRIDRLVVGDPVWIVDFKSDAIPADDPNAVPPAYLAQLGLYRRAIGKVFPNKHIEAAILWTETGGLMPLDAPMLDAASHRFTAG